MGNIPHTAPVTSVLAPCSDNAAPRFDPSTPHLARVYSYWLGGKDHFPPDRLVAEEVLAHRPQVVTGVRANRDFLTRAVEYLAREAGIGQFLDVGAGLPAPGATHEIAQAIVPRARVVYADHDRLVLAHARALLSASSRQGAVACVEADVRDPAAMLAGAAPTLDLSRPVAVLLLAILHFVTDEMDPAGIVAALAGGLAPGSYVAISHATADFAPQEVTAGVAAYNTLMPVQITMRTHRQVTGMFAGLPLVAPGVVPVSGWRPRPLDALPLPADLYAGVARVTRGRP
jgi:hypothetical protein